MRINGKTIERVYHDYRRLEEFHAGMWRTAAGDDAQEFIRKSRELMIDAAAFKAAMIRAVNEWPLSCEHNLTAQGVNRLAWLGHAGCCINHGSPEALTRLAWHTLDPGQQDLANLVAQEALEQWETIKESVDAQAAFEL